MKRKEKQIISGVAGAVMMLSGCAAEIPQDAQPQMPADTAAEPESAAAGKTVDGYVLTDLSHETPEYIRIANADGTFEFNQDVLSPKDDIFNLFGTALTGVCAKPAFAVGDGEEAVGDYYINVGGRVKHGYRVDLNGFKIKEETKIMSCNCATGEGVATASITGVPLSAILELAGLENNANTVTVRGKDGFGIPMPLSYALDKEALIVYKINGEELPDHQNTQLWMPGTVAKYFTRNIVDIEVTAEEEVPEVIEASDEYRAQVSIVNYAQDRIFPVGDPITFEGYADDYDKTIAAIEVSMDGGETWTSYDTEGTTADKWVYWYFTYTPEEAGTYKLMVRAVTEDGMVSPLASALYFEAGEGDTPAV